MDHHNNGESTTILEDFLQNIELLPNDVRRDFELMKKLDSDSNLANRELSDAEASFLSVYKNQFAFPPMSQIAFKNIESKRALAKEKQDGKVAVAENLLLTIEKYSKKIDADISIFEAMLKKTGNFEALGAAPGTEVAIRTDMYAENDWILGRVLNFYQDTGYFDIADMDDSSKRHFLSELQVILLPFDVGDMKFAKGEDIYAVYPDTTSFYPATVIYGPKKLAGTHTISVQFHGDHDSFGQLPIKNVPLKHVIRS